jgi:choline dehydrogenase-like flavoprotein
VADNERVDLEPFRQRALEAIAPQPFYFDELTPWFAGVADAARGHGLEVATGPYNIRDAMRWNAAFAYLEPARLRANLTIRANALAERVVFDGECAVGAVVDAETVEAEVVVLSAGAIGSPRILLRSGVEVEGLGENLQDHVSAKLVFETTDALLSETPMPFSNGIVKTSDLHPLPIARTSRLRRCSRSRAGASAWTSSTSSIDETLGIYFHPVGTCAIGTVIGDDFRVHGFENLSVCDASVCSRRFRVPTRICRRWRSRRN